MTWRANGRELIIVPLFWRKTGIDILKASEAEMAAKLEELGVKYEGNNRERLMDTLCKNIAARLLLVQYF